ncbi:MAG: ABC transporter permease [Geodermatophilaceae bacterium]|nr:ABC transporter permease [Geodermatophilaceae bacterium]
MASDTHHVPSDAATLSPGPASLPRGYQAVFEGKMLNYRGNWKGSVVSSILEPVLFLAAMGISLGTLVDQGGRLDQGVGYLVFLAPGLLAATAMQTATFESTYPIMGALKWHKTFEGILSTPVKVRDLVTGHLLFILFRLVTTLVVFLAVMAAFGALVLPVGLLALPAAALTGLAIAAPVSAFAAWVQNDAGFAALLRFGIVPMFLFSGTFFPVDQLPGVLQPVAYATPLWHGVSLTRGLALAQLDPTVAAINVTYLGAVMVLGVWLARRQFAKRLVI